MDAELRNLALRLRTDAARDHLDGRPERAQVREEVARDLETILDKEHP